jgi:hypothetical protein
MCGFSLNLLYIRLSSRIKTHHSDKRSLRKAHSLHNAVSLATNGQMTTQTQELTAEISVHIYIVYSIYGMGDFRVLTLVNFSRI